MIILGCVLGGSGGFVVLGLVWVGWVWWGFGVGGFGWFSSGVVLV